jgi:hypothetical protein
MTMDSETFFWIMIVSISILWVIVDELRLESRENDD